jgi:hypothetical protein
VHVPQHRPHPETRALPTIGYRALGYVYIALRLGRFGFIPLDSGHAGALRCKSTLGGLIGSLRGK